MPSPRLIAPLLLLIACGPALAFPDMVPDAWRTSFVTVVTLTNFCLALYLLRPWKNLGLGVGVGLGLFVLAAAASWAAMPAYDLFGLRHFAGIGVGVLVMAVVATWCTTSERLVTASLAVALASIAILTLGLLSTSIRTTKFSDPNEDLPTRFWWAPSFRLDLPGMRSDGEVNPNALGGTALMLLPMCAGLTASALLGGRRRRVGLAAGGVATMIALAVLGITMSRMVVIAALLTLIVWGLRWQRGRRWVLLLLLFVTVGLAIGAVTWRLASPEGFADALDSTQHTVNLRVAFWMEALERLRASPWVGIGINQFHLVPKAAEIFGGMHIPHAHNVLIQVALDVGVPGLIGYVLLFSSLLVMADRTAGSHDPTGRIVAGAGLSLLAVHFFGIGDTIALGAKMGGFQWFSSGLILAGSHLQRSAGSSQIG